MGVDASDPVAERTNDEGLLAQICAAARDWALKEDSAWFVGRARSVAL